MHLTSNMGMLEKIVEGGMEKHICTNCGYVYDPNLGDPDNGIEPGTPFESLPADWVCPVCYVGKDMFDQL